MNERRIKRLQEQIKSRIAEVLMREIRDPKVGLVTVTRVELDKEFTICKAYWSVLGDKHQRAHTDRALKRAAGFVQREVGSTLHTRTVPRLTFLYDEQIAEAARIQEQLAELRRERQARTGTDDEGGTGDSGAGDSGAGDSGIGDSGAGHTEEASDQAAPSDNSPDSGPGPNGDSQPPQPGSSPLGS